MDIAITCKERSGLGTSACGTTGTSRPRKRQTKLSVVIKVSQRGLLSKITLLKIAFQSRAEPNALYVDRIVAQRLVKRRARLRAPAQQGV